MTEVIKKHKTFLIILTLGFIYLLIGEALHIVIPCVFFEVTGLYCPGCGSTRMLKSIIKLDFYQAFRFNPFLFILFPFALVLLIDHIYSLLKGKKSLYKKIPNYVYNTILVIALIYWILRNIFPILAPTVV